MNTTITNLWGYPVHEEKLNDIQYLNRTKNLLEDIKEIFSKPFQLCEDKTDCSVSDEDIIFINPSDPKKDELTILCNYMILNWLCVNHKYKNPYRCLEQLSEFIGGEHDYFKMFDEYKQEIITSVDSYIETIDRLLAAL